MEKPAHEMSLIMQAELPLEIHLEALRQARLRAAWRGVSQEVRDDIQEQVLTIYLENNQ